VNTQGTYETKKEINKDYSRPQRLGRRKLPLKNNCYIQLFLLRLNCFEVSQFQLSSFHILPGGLQQSYPAGKKKRQT
jgi:hypothetical protein